MVSHLIAGVMITIFCLGWGLIILAFICALLSYGRH